MGTLSLPADPTIAYGTTYQATTDVKTMLVALGDLRYMGPVVASGNASAAWKRMADYVCDGIDDHVEINAALNSLGTAGGVVIKSPNRFIGGKVIIPPRCYLQGQGRRATVYQAKNSLNDDIITTQVSTSSSIEDATYCGVIGMAVDGNSANNTSGRGVVFANSLSPGQSPGTLQQATNGGNDWDSHRIMRNVLIWRTAGDGFASGGYTSDEIHDVHIYETVGHGFVPSFDSHYSNCVAGMCGKNGFHIAVPSVRLVDCKAFYAGNSTVSAGTSGYGFWIDGGTGICIASCEAQDNKLAGLWMSNAWACNIQMVLDSNCTSVTTGQGAAMEWSNFQVMNNIVRVACYERGAANGTGRQKYAFHLPGLTGGSFTTAGNDVVITNVGLSPGTITGTMTTASVSPGSGNRVFANAVAV